MENEFEWNSPLGKFTAKGKTANILCLGVTVITGFVVWKVCNDKEILLKALEVSNP